MKTKKKIKELEERINKLEKLVFNVLSVFSGKKTNLSPIDIEGSMELNKPVRVIHTIPTGPCGVTGATGLTGPITQQELPKQIMGATGPCGTIGSTGPTEVRKPRIISESIGCTGFAYGEDLYRLPTGSIGLTRKPDLSFEQKESWQKSCKDSNVHLLKSKLSMINYHMGPTGAGSMEYETLESSKTNSDHHEYNFKLCFQYLKDLM